MVAAFAAIAATMLQNISLDLVEAGIVVLAIEFRNSPEAPYRAALQDINYGIRWLKSYFRLTVTTSQRRKAIRTW